MPKTQATPGNTAPVVIVDGSSYLFRAYHALPPLTNSSGKPTGAIQGVMNMLQKIIDEYKPTLMCVVFDTKGPNFRHELFPEYKANRDAPPEDLIAQIEPLHTLIRTMGIALVALPGIEADDVIGALAQQAAAQQHQVIISSGDKDLAQLVTEQIHLVNTMKREYLTPTGVFEKFGVRPDQIIDYLSLIGDKADNIPGIDKVGPKTAVKWLTQYDSITQIVNNSDQIKGKVGEHLRAQIDRLAIAVKLVTLKTEIELPVSIQELKITEPNTHKMVELLTQLEFKNALKKFEEKYNLTAQQAITLESTESQQPEHQQQQTAQYDMLTTEQAVLDYLKKVARAPWLAFDTETTSLEVHSAELVGVSMAINDQQAVYIPCAHISTTSAIPPQQVSRAFLIKHLAPILQQETPKKIGQNLKYDMNILKKYGITMSGIGADTMLQSYILNPTAGRHDMGSLASRFLNRTTTSFTDIAGKGVKQKTFDQIELDIATAYAAEDAAITWQLHDVLREQLQAQAQLNTLYTDIELALMPVLAEMEYHGALIDADELAQQSQTLAQRLCQLEKQAFDLVGEPFNMASPKQIGAILYDQMAIPVIKKTPKGAPSTAESVLQDLAKEHELPRILLEHRSCAKLKSTYTDKLPELMHPTTGRIHTSYHQAVTATGRLSSSDPNLQNIPIKTEAGRLIRKAFIAPKNHVLIAADYSQIELRLMAHFSKDAKLCRAFTRNEDVHSLTASEIFDVSLNQVNTDQRRAAKAINFGLIYGMSAFGLSNQLNITRKEAQEYIDRYFHRYPGVLEYINSAKESAQEAGYVETFFGRRLYLPDLQSKNHSVRQGAERTAVNAPLQGTAADIVKIAMLNIHQWLAQQQLSSKMILQVHDEIVFEAPQAEQDVILKQIPTIMSKAVTLDIPLEVSIGTGPHWLEAH